MNVVAPDLVQYISPYLRCHFCCSKGKSGWRWSNVWFMIGQPATEGGIWIRRLSYVTRKYIVGRRIKTVLRIRTCIDGREVSTSALKYGTLIFGAIVNPNTKCQWNRNSRDKKPLQWQQGLKRGLIRCALYLFTNRVVSLRFLKKCGLARHSPTTPIIVVTFFGALG